MRLCPWLLTLDIERMRDAVYVLFERLGDLVLDHIGIGSRIGARHRDDGIVDTRVFAYAEVAVPDEPE